MGRRISGRDFDVMLGDLMIHVETMSATIDDAKTVAKTKGVPNGHLAGEVSCNGEIEVDTQNFNLIIEAAKKAKSFEELKPFDIVTAAEGDDDKFKLEMFGCTLRISDLLNIDTKGGEKNKHKLPFDVTSPDFVRINGVPYLSSKTTENIR
jgi:hypothetical protein